MPPLDDFSPESCRFPVIFRNPVSGRAPRALRRDYESVPRKVAGRGTRLATINIYGSRDIYVSQRGDTSSDGYYYESAEAVISKWAGPGSQECDPATTVYETSQDGALGLACIQHDNCSTGAEVVHCTWDGAHDWPQAEGQQAGNELIWEFFSKHSRAKFRP